MKRSPFVSVWQLVLLFSAARLSNGLLLPADSLHALSLPELLLVILFEDMLLLLFLLPTCHAFSRTPPKLFGTRFFKQATGFGLLLLYALVLLLDMTQFTDFAEKTVKAEFSVSGLTVLVLATAMFAAFHGIQALCRTATVVAVFAIGSVVLFALLLLPQMNTLHFPPATISEPSGLISIALQELPRTAEVVAIGALYPHIKGDVTKGCHYFVVLNTVVSVLICVTVTGVLGDFSAFTAYPYYAALNVVHLGVLPRMDMVITALWLGTFFIRFSLFFWLFIDRFCHLFGTKRKLPAALCIGVIIVLFLVGFKGGVTAALWDEITVVYGLALVLFGLVLPIGRLIRRKS